MQLSKAQTRVILIRHGRSTFNEQGRYQGSSDSAVLTQVGIETAHLVGRHLKKISVDAPIHQVYTSPLKRVQQTAHNIIQAMAPAAHPPMTISHNLKEISLSLWEGLTYQQVQQQYAEAYQCWQRRPHEFELPLEIPTVGNAQGPLHRSAVHQKAAEKRTAIANTLIKNIAPSTYFPVQNLYQQAQQFWDKTLPQHPGQTLVIVSHSGTIHALISTALGAGAKHHHSLQQSNCGISELVFSGEGNVQLSQLNQTTTLGETLPKIKAGKHGLRLLLLAADGLNSQDCKQLAKRLTTLPVDFCLSANKAQQWMRRLLQPQTLQLGTQNSDFLNDWQHRLRQAPRLAKPLMTGLAIAPAAKIEQLLLQTLGAPPSSANIALHPGTFSIIHYPHNHRPVIQAINS